MAASFPTSLDAFSNPGPSSLLDDANPLLDHDFQHSHGNDSIAALQAKVGIDSSAVVTSLDYKISHLTKSSVGLGNVDNTSDVNKPVSTATQTALNLKADLASPPLTGTPTAPTATAGTSTTQLATTAFVTAADALKANLASPPLTGTPTSPTATLGTNTTQIATTAFVAAAVAALVNSAPGALDTLNELAASLGNDANFATTVTNFLADIRTQALVYSVAL